MKTYEQLQPGMLHQAEIDRRARELEAQYEPLPAGAPGPRKPRWTRFAKFPLTVRRFERVFNAQGEPWLLRWAMAVKFALPTLRKTSEADR